ncbi:hypothetical protein CYMTET_11276 [Cymbomonas tetramitiformis]|uniref:Uncharacterized protein n=1 Tax=Cymbomonas tetramitiformis TaxID=36881 RepID=A0AAE0LDB6_9CHLO|nr:hypothetical protein CYMTET_11276 [Cymbomonas tetramitiformis]
MASSMPPRVEESSVEDDMRLPRKSGKVEPLEQAYRELARNQVAQGSLNVVILTPAEALDFQKGVLYKLLRRYIIHFGQDNCLVLVATYGDAHLGNGPKFLGLMFIGPFFSLRDPQYAHLSPWTSREYTALNNDRRKLMQATLHNKDQVRSWASPFFEAKKVVGASTYAHRVEQILVFPSHKQWTPKNDVNFDSDIRHFLKNGELYNDPFFLELQELLERGNYNKYNTRPFQVVFGPQEACSPTPISLEEFNVLFYGGVSSMQANDFSFTPRSMDTILSLVSEDDPSLQLGCARVCCELNPQDIFLLLDYLQSKAQSCSGGLPSKHALSTWFGLALVPNSTYGYRLSSRDVQPADTITSRLFSMVNEQVNKTLSMTNSFRVDAVKAYFLPFRKHFENVQVQFPFQDGSVKDFFFVDTARAILFLFDSPREDSANPTSEPQDPVADPSVHLSDPGASFLSLAVAATEPAAVSSVLEDSSSFCIPRRRTPAEIDPSVTMDIKFPGVDKLSVGNGQLLVLSGDIASQGFRIFRASETIGFRGVLVFHMLNMHTVIRTNRCLKRHASDLASE